jgi:hypothetical protein
MDDSTLFVLGADASAVIGALSEIDAAVVALVQRLLEPR